MRTRTLIDLNAAASAPKPVSDSRLALIRAGGPGSGRHPGLSLHDTAEAHGFKRLNKSAHLRPMPAKGNVAGRMDSVFINEKKNTWEHRLGANENGTKGYGAASLDQHLSNFYKK